MAWGTNADATWHARPRGSATQTHAQMWRGHVARRGESMGTPGVAPRGGVTVMEDHAHDQATARAEPDGARVLPRRSTRADVRDPGFKYTA